ncbi:porin [Hoeflea sp. WL0058]|uniref:Porin n=1 Tax=Flavimaribacter sediminis TaxID=2865987 RepID=A0AAE2ZS55_9HYPH|nr:porin [Flavimaribacter sediminis]MBW8639508.1 porin [Flavimaribacter sediminis]
MKIKSLLLGSAAALFAASGASAADAIIAAEPEPVEYVRVCDAFGNGYFYIPGTETCLRISGYVWFQVGATDVSWDSAYSDTWENSTRARVNIDARSDTEWGELASRIRLQGTWGNNVDGNTTVDQAWIRLGGLFMGYSESYWVNAYNTGPTNFGSHSWDGMGYGYQQRHQIGYTFNTGNFYIAASVEDNSQLEPNGFGGVSPSWTPDFVGKIGGQIGSFNIFAKAGYDAFTGNAGYGAGLVTDVGSAGNFILYGYWAPDGSTSYGGNKSFAVDTGTGNCLFGGIVYSAFGSCQVTPEWSVLGSFRWQFTPEFSASIGAQYFGDFYYPTGTGLGDFSTGIDAWQAELELVWTPVTDFEIRAYIQYFDADQIGDVTTGFLRFTRSF